VYQIIQQAGTNGVWIRDIRVQSNLQQPRLTKILKNLEGRKLVKTVTLHANTNKKIYMLYELTPGEELTGGAWCGASMSAPYICLSRIAVLNTFFVSLNPASPMYKKIIQSEGTTVEDVDDEWTKEAVCFLMSY
jgi:hypothetical protein